jgi:hypothetical protein
VAGAATGARRPGVAGRDERADGRIVRVSVPIHWPATIRHAGRGYRTTGQEGDRVADRAQAAESGDARGQRVWLAADGAVVEELATAAAVDRRTPFPLLRRQLCGPQPAGHKANCDH